MRDYGKVFSTFWTSETTRDLSDDGKLLAFYLLTGPHTSLIGSFRLPDGYASGDLGWAPERVSKGFEDLFQKGFATRDEESNWGVVHNYLKFNPIKNPNQFKSAIKLFGQIPDTAAIKSIVAAALENYCDKLPEKLRTAIEPFRNSFNFVSKQNESVSKQNEFVSKPVYSNSRRRAYGSFSEPNGSEPLPLSPLSDSSLPDREESIPGARVDAESSEPADHEAETHEAETGSDQPQKSAAMPKVNPGEKPEAYHRRYMSWARDEISRLKAAKRDEWAVAYPAVDLDRECAKASAWLDANPQRRKKQIAKFLNGWLARSQEHGGVSARGSPLLNTAEQRQAVTVNAVKKILEDIGDG
jgi:hypothetical protein